MEDRCDAIELHATARVAVDGLAETDDLGNDPLGESPLFEPLMLDGRHGHRGQVIRRRGKSDRERVAARCHAVHDAPPPTAAGDE